MNSSQTNISSNSNSNSNINANEINIIKYQQAAAIINNVMRQVINKCIAGAAILDVCDFGDKLILSELGKVYTKKGKGDSKVDKGIAFPVTLCVNEICNNYTPIDKNEVLNVGDLVKINMGCHIDGHIAVIGHTIYVDDDETKSIEGPKGHVLKCAYILSGLLLNNIRAGKTCGQVTHTILQACKDLECTIIPECYTYQMKKYVYEGSKYISFPDPPETKQDKIKIEEGDIFLIDISVTSGESKFIKTDFKTNIFKRDVTNHYELRTNLGRNFMEEVSKRFPVLPFHLRYLDDQRAALMGIPEALRHGLFKPYHVQSVKKNDVVAQFKYTILVKAEGIKIITGLPCTQLSRCKLLKDVTQSYILDVLKAEFFPKQKVQTENAENAVNKNNDSTKTTK